MKPALGSRSSISRLWVMIVGCSCSLFSATVPLWAQGSLATDTAQPLGWLTGLMHRHGVWVGLPAVFLGGLALNLTPCVYPMIPVTLAFFSQQASGAARRIVLLAGCYVLGISLSYALLGLLAAQTGALFGSWLQSPIVLIWITLAIISLALSMFGFYEIRLPSALANRLGAASTGVWGAFLMGMMVGVVAAPCVGPFLVGLMLLISQLGNPVAGFLLFFVLGIGMGIPSLVLAIASSRIGGLPKAGAWLLWSKKALGIVLLGLALYFLRPLLSAAVLTAAIVGLLVFAGAYLGWLERSQSRLPAPPATAVGGVPLKAVIGGAQAGGRRFVVIRRATGVGLLLAAVAVGWPSSSPHHAASPIAWVPYSHAALEEAQRAHRPIVIDVYADWCLPCVEMDHVTFRQSRVVEALRDVATLRVDATREVTPEAQALLERYRIFGAPTVLLFDRAGNERTDLRLTGFATPDEFLERLRQVL